MHAMVLELGTEPCPKSCDPPHDDFPVRRHFFCECEQAGNVITLGHLANDATPQLSAADASLISRNNPIGKFYWKDRFGVPSCF